MIYTDVGYLHIILFIIYVYRYIYIYYVYRYLYQIQIHKQMSHPVGPLYVHLVYLLFILRVLLLLSCRKAFLSLIVTAGGGLPMASQLLYMTALAKQKPNRTKHRLPKTGASRSETQNREARSHQSQKPTEDTKSQKKSLEKSCKTRNKKGTE